MREIVVSMQNTLLSEAVAWSLAETGEFRVEQVLPGKTGDTFSLCRAVQADILLMEVSRLPAYTLENRLKLIECVRRAMPNCKFVLLCDENGDPELARRVMIVRQDRLIDAFLYASVTPAYLTAALGALLERIDRHEKTMEAHFRRIACRADAVPVSMLRRSRTP